MKHRATKKSRQTPSAVKREVCLRAGGKWNPESKICTGGTCELCHGKKMDARGLKFMHKRRRKMGGTTSPEIHSPENIFRSCFICDEENDGVILPKSKPVDRPLVLSGHGTGYGTYWKWQQTGSKPENK